jgi:hypothetical protein
MLKRLILIRNSVVITGRCFNGRWNDTRSFAGISQVISSPVRVRIIVSRDIVSVSTHLIDVRPAVSLVNFIFDIRHAWCTELTYLVFGGEDDVGMFEFVRSSTM